MRANDYLKTIEPNCDFYDILKKLIYEFAYYRNDKEGTERVYNFYLLQDKTRKKYLDELKMWELLEQDKNHKPTYYENTFGITHDIASHIRDLLFSAIENDKSFGYLFYLLASEKNRTEIFYQNNPIDCIPDKKLIEETIYNYQDDYPKKSLEEFLTYCDFNYSFYKANKKLLHTQDFWFSIFTDAYTLFDNLRTKMVTPFLAYDLFKEFSETNKSKKILITTLVTQLLEQYNFDLSEEQVRGKKILVDEIQNYLDALKSGEIPADPTVRSVGWLSKHPELMTKGEQQDMLNTFKLLKDFGNEINTIFPPFELVKSKIDETAEIDEKIKILEDVIATWEVNKNIAIKHRNDDTAEEIGDKNISLFTDLLIYWKKMKELHSKTNSQNIISEKLNEISFENDSMDNTNQIVSKLKAINDNLLETIQILNLYLQGGILPPFKVEKLKELKQMFGYKSYTEIIAPIENDKQLVTNITNAVFFDLWEFAIDFLDLYNLKQNDKKFNEYKVKIIQIGNEIDFYLDAFECLRYNLNNLHIFYTSHGIPFTGKWSIEKYGINLDYNDLLLEALNEYDLTKRKEFILKKLHSAELFKLQDTVDKEDFDEFDYFIDKCYKVVESIDFQIKNTTTTVSPNKKPRTILDEKREMNEAYNNPEAIAAMEEASKNMFRKLTDKDIELVTNDCNTLNEVYIKGLDVYEAYFSNNQITTEDIQFLQTDPFSGLLSDNYFGAMVLSHFDDPVVIGTIFDICFGDTIYRIQNLDFTFCSIPELNNEPRLKELIRTILKNNKNSVLIKDNLLSFAKQIRELIDLVYAYTGNPEYIKNVNLNVFKSDSFFTELETKSNAVELPENYINNGGIITTGSYDIEEYFRFFQTKNSNKELYLVDKLEISLAHYASNYKQNCDNYWETYKFDPNYFNEFIPGELLSEFNLQLHDFIKPLNNHEINRFLTTSIQQFKTHTPEKRINAFFEIYHDVYWYPNYLKYTGSTSRDNYVIHICKLYSNHFHLFQEATQSAYDIFKASLTIGSVNLISSNTNLYNNTKKGNNAELLKSNLYENGFFEVTKVKSLSHDGQSKLLDLLVLNETPYIVAMFDFLGFFRHLTNELGFTNTKIHSKLSSWLQTSAQAVKCNMLVLNDSSELRKNDRYTSHLHKEKVKTDYHLLK